MFDLGGGELLLILIAVLLLFGPKKLPHLAQSLGKGVREFKRAQRDFTEQINTAIAEEERKSSPRPKSPNTISRTSPKQPTDTVQKGKELLNEPESSMIAEERIIRASTENVEKQSDNAPDGPVSTTSSGNPDSGDTDSSKDDRTPTQ